MLLRSVRGYDSDPPFTLNPSLCGKPVESSALKWVVLAPLIGTPNKLSHLAALDESHITLNQSNALKRQLGSGPAQSIYSMKLPRCRDSPSLGPLASAGACAQSSAYLARR